MRVKALVLAGENGFAEIFRNLIQGHDGSFFSMDASYFGSNTIENDRSLGHFVDTVEIVFHGTRAVDCGHDDQCAETCNDRCADGEHDEPVKARKTSGEVKEELEWPEYQNGYQIGTAISSLGFGAPPVGLLLASCHWIRWECKRFADHRKL